MATRINFKELRRQLSFEDILAHYNVTLKARGDQRQGFCPLPTHEGTRNSPSFSANVAKGIWQCFGCGASGNLIEFAARMEGLDPDNPQNFRQAALLLAKRYDGFGGGKDKEKKPVAMPEPEKGSVDEGEVKRCTATPTSVNVPLDFELTSLDFTHPYLCDRGFHDETIRAFGLGYCNRGLMKGRIAIPLHDRNGALIGYAGRVADDTAINEDTPRYLFPSSRERKGERYEFRKSEFLYNGFRVKDVRDLVVVESFTVLWWLAQAGIASVVALMGASCSERQAELVKELVVEDGRVWVLADGDPAGERMAESTMKLLAPHRFVRWVKFEDGKQPTDLSPGELHTLLPVV